MKILAALDSTPRAPRVLKAALQFAQPLRATVVPFRSVQVPPELPPAAATSHRDELPDFLVAEARGDLERLTGGAAAAWLSEPVVEIGEPWRAIVHAADRLAVDWVVVGSHGYHGIDRLLGTNARRVADAAHQDVLVVHDGRGEPPPVRSMLVALSGSPRDGLVLARGIAMAHALGASVHLIRVVEELRLLLASDQVIVADLDLSSAGPATDELRSAAVGEPSVVSRRVVVSAGRAWRAILEGARALEADLIVVGSHGRRFGDAVLRTTPGHAADEAKEYVLIVHDGAR